MLLICLNSRSTMWENVVRDTPCLSYAILIVILQTYQMHVNSNNTNNSANGDRIHCLARYSYFENIEHSVSELVCTRNPELQEIQNYIQSLSTLSRANVKRKAAMNIYDCACAIVYIAHNLLIIRNKEKTTFFIWYHILYIWNKIALTIWQFYFTHSHIRSWNTSAEC